LFARFFEPAVACGSGVARIALMQKRIIDAATLAGKVCITATQMLESMIEAPSP